MSQTFTRLSKNYLQLARQDVANYFPKNVFLREPINCKGNSEEITVKVTT